MRRIEVVPKSGLLADVKYQATRYTKSQQIASISRISFLLSPRD
jgi:hypothetical protein